VKFRNRKSGFCTFQA